MNATSLERGWTGLPTRVILPVFLVVLTASSAIAQPPRLPFRGRPQPPGAGSQQSVDKLIQDLKGRRPAPKLAALRALAAMGPSAAPAVPQLETLLADPNPLVRSGALAALKRIGQPAVVVLEKAAGQQGNPLLRVQAVAALAAVAPDKVPLDKVVGMLGSGQSEQLQAALTALERLNPEKGGQAVPALLASLKQGSSTERSEVLSLLGKFRQQAEAAVPHLVKFATSQDAGERLAAIESLGRLGGDARQSVDQLRKLLDSKDQHTRVAAAQAIARIDPQNQDAIKDVVGRLVEAIQSKDKDGIVGQEATTGLAELGGQAVPALKQLLGQGDAEVKQRAMAALQRIGSEAKAAVPELQQALGDADPQVKQQALGALGAIGGEAQQALPQVISATRDKNDLTRAYAMKAAGQIGAGDTGAVSAMVGGLADANATVRREAAQGLAAAKPKSDPAITGLIAALKDKDQSVVVRSAEALEEIGGPAVPALAEAVSDPAIRFWCVVILGRIGPPAKSAADKLTAAAGDRDLGVRCEALMSLGAVGAADEKTVGLLVRSLADGKNSVRQSAAFALGMLGEEAAAATRALGGALKDPDPLTRFVAATALTRVAPGLSARSDTVIGMLTTGLRNESPQVRVESALALSNLGSAAQSASAQLKQLTEDADPAVRQAAAAALKKIGGQSR